MGQLKNGVKSCLWRIACTVRVMKGKLTGLVLVASLEIERKDGFIHFLFIYY